MPSTAKKVVEQCGATIREYDDLDKFGLLANGTKVEENPSHIFARIDVAKVSKELIEKGLVKVEEEQEEPKQEKKEVKNQEKTPEKEDKKQENVVDIQEITIDDFAKIQLRVGKILTAEKVEKADKLLKFSVQIGSEVRTIVSGIAKYYTPEEMVGKSVVVVFNLKPAKLRGIESQGMLLCACAKNDDGSENVVIVSPEKPVESGCVVR